MDHCRKHNFDMYKMRCRQNVIGNLEISVDASDNLRFRDRSSLRHIQNVAATAMFCFWIRSFSLDVGNMHWRKAQ